MRMAEGLDGLWTRSVGDEWGVLGELLVSNR